MSVFPPGVPASVASIKSIRQPRLRAEVTPGGGLFGLQLLGTDGKWITASSPMTAEYGIVDHGSCQVTVSGVENEVFRFTHQNGSYSEVVGGKALLRPSQIVSCQHTGQNPWNCVAWGFDSKFGDDRLPYVWFNTTITESVDRIGVQVEVHRTPHLPQIDLNTVKEPWMTLDRKELQHVTINGETTMAAKLPAAGAPALAVVAPREARFRFKGGRTLLLKWTTADSIRHWVNSDRVYAFTTSIRNAELETNKPPVVAQYSLEVV
jgi:hypothetical protein